MAPNWSDNPYKPWFFVKRLRLVVVVILLLMRLIWPYDASIVPVGKAAAKYQFAALEAHDASA